MVMRSITIDDIPDSVYEALEGEAGRHGRSVAEQALHLVERSLEGARRKPRSILELRGLGKEIWAGVDPSEHVRKERDSWT